MKDQRNKLSDEERNQLFLEYNKKNDRNILNELFEKHLFLAENMAKKFSNNHYSGNFEEAFAVAQEGLFHAIKNYDVNIGNFRVYAYKCIRGYLMTQRKEVLHNANKNLITTFLKAKLVVEEEYQERLSDNGQNYDRMVEDIIKILYLDNVCNEKYDYNHGKMTEFDIKDLININNCLAYEEEVVDPLQTDDKELSTSIEYDQFKKEVEQSINEGLNKREQYIIRQRFGFSDGEIKTLREVGKSLSISGEAVRQSEERALGKLKAIFERKRINRFL